MDQFLDSLIHFDKEHISENNLKAVEPYLKNKEFDAEFIRNKSTAAAGASIMCMILLTVILYISIYVYA